MRKETFRFRSAWRILRIKAKPKGHYQHVARVLCYELENKLWSSQEPVDQKHMKAYADALKERILRETTIPAEASSDVERILDEAFGAGMGNRVIRLFASRSAKTIRRSSVQACPVTGKFYHRKQAMWVSARGLGVLVERGMDAFAARYGGPEWVFPHNFVWTEATSALNIGPTPFRYGKRPMSREGAKKLIREYSRIGGWLKAAGSLTALSRVIFDTQSPAGLGSPYTTIELEKLQKKFPSPGRLERLLWKVRRRSEEILSAFEGEKTPSWVNIAQSLMTTGRVGKAAVIVAARTMSWEHRGATKRRERGFSLESYRKARRFLMSIRSAKFPIEDASDGVVSRRATEPILSKMGISVYPIRIVQKYGRCTLGLIVMTSSGRSFHAESGLSPEQAMQNAVWAWKKQDRLAKENADLASFLDGQEFGFSPLLVVEDSLSAGNCRIGTRRWMERQGWEGRLFVPGPWLKAHLGDPRVARVVSAARESRLTL